MFPDELSEKNRAWAAGRAAQPLPPAEAVRLAVVACYDPRLDPLLRPALGLAEGQGFLFRSAGARVTEDGRTLRSLAMAVYMFQVREILVLGHSSCRMAAFETRDFVAAFRARGVQREAFGDQDLRTWAGAIASPRQGVIESAAAIAEAPFLPRDLAIAGAVLDDTTGRIEVVLRPDEPIPDAIRDVGSADEQAADGPRLDTADGAAGHGVVVPPPAPAAPPVPGVLRPIYDALDDLSSQSQMSAQVAELRRQLEKEAKPLLKLGLVHDFVMSAAADKREMRDAFFRLRQEIMENQVPHFERFLLPLLKKGKA